MAVASSSSSQEKFYSNRWEFRPPLSRTPESRLRSPAPSTTPLLCSPSTLNKPPFSSVAISPSIILHSSVALLFILSLLCSTLLCSAFCLTLVSCFLFQKQGMGSNERQDNDSLFYIVTEGQIALFDDLPNRRDVNPFLKITAGRSFGGSAFFFNSQRAYTAVAATPTRVLCIDPKTFTDKVLDSHSLRNLYDHYATFPNPEDPTGKKVM